ncbi:D-alanyl-D-alanine carboxypeptidase [Virgibacillus sp. NKC19-3]|uniref:D-alanyl-D-alanine carboxypeptidase family protein n=1 Tax=Virgibacillus saliphilus TaxID=2831674 RepID=UPI001C9A95FC|nr:D-alanyl-D-alanine carboxypeptidase family protein [Virgibacillus sp. NKC19-3]MBY7143458.1 D-alanyl-D-alanine carboxypeptidase [Virgibacillus sp. NKC19-3]
MRIFLCSILILLFTLIHPISGQAAPKVSANNAILIEQSTGRVLFEKNANEEQLVASITKLMTAIIAVESGKMHEETIASRKAINTEGSAIYLEQGEKMSIEDLVYGLILRSGNDAAVTISEHIGGSMDGFVYLMNEKARWLGMTNSSFENPHGLDSDNHYSTAYDMAILMKYAMDNDQFREIIGTKTYKSDKRTYPWQNKNKLLTQLYENSTGGKTGYTKTAGRTLVSSAHKNGMDLIVVTINAPDDWQDHINLFEWGFENYDMKSIAKEGREKYHHKGSDNEIIGYLHQDVLFPLTEGEMEDINKQTYLRNDNHAEDVIGKTMFHLGGEQIAETTIFNNPWDMQEKGFFSNVISTYKKISGLDEIW